jgi:outer membrane protein TolC
MEALTAEAVVEQVLVRNPTLSQMTAAWQAALARYPQVTSLDDPNLGVVIAPGSIGSNNVEFGYRVEVSQKFPYPGKRNLRGEASQAEADAALMDVADVHLQLVETAITAFGDYFLAFRALQVNDENLKLLQSARKTAASRVETAKAAQQEVLQIDVEIGRQRERGRTLERMKQVGAARINTLMHLPPDSPLPPPPDNLPPAGALPSVDSLRARAVLERPDLQALASRIKADEAQLGVAHREFCPDFEAMAAYDTIMGNGPNRDLAGQIGVRLNVPLRRDRRRAAVSEAEQRLAERRAELARLTDQVHLQVQEAYEQLTESADLVRLYETSILPAAESNIKSAQPAYVAGQIPLLGVLEAERNLVGLRDRYYETLADSLRRRALLERVVGGPLRPPQIAHDAAELQAPVLLPPDPSSEKQLPKLPSLPAPKKAGGGEGAERPKPFPLTPDPSSTTEEGSELPPVPDPFPPKGQRTRTDSNNRVLPEGQ